MEIQADIFSLFEKQIQFTNSERISFGGVLEFNEDNVRKNLGRSSGGRTGCGIVSNLY
ncbi:hypothetical protein LEP1GSC038_1195 [Leptospira weilii str. 2006001855]|uniref:Uncharacterized protein n=1 Tax=Leptospira weilii str. 2006001855 TaxID=996804 RepID=M6FK32_9LEPT|nr:hypothetical protein LEP1GSC038_1195 [Leptospira weilii str. 2006001855]